jgi:hypothetical protein
LANRHRCRDPRGILGEDSPLRWYSDCAVEKQMNQAMSSQWFILGIIFPWVGGNKDLLSGRIGIG